MNAILDDLFQKVKIMEELASLRQERDELREALRAIVECPDYRSIHTHEMNQARALLTRKGETRA